ncbi:MAG: hypothetical protein AAF687_03355 [Pseudomonadota bacterium]
MTNAVRPPATGSNRTDAPAAPESWRELRGDDAIQFEEVEIPTLEPEEPGWFAEMIQSVLDFLADIFAPIGEALGLSWPVLQWVLLGLAVLFAAFLIYRMLGPMGLSPNAGDDADEVEEWVPDKAESLALLEDADRLAAEGKFDEATHMLLKRSVNQIATARPDWVEPSSTARELAALPALSSRARGAFEVISQRVERSLFALSALDRSDWEAARAAYADFALVKIEDARAGGGAA